MKFHLTPDRPKPLSAVRAGATSDARWRRVPSAWVVDSLLVLNAERDHARALAIADVEARNSQ